MNAIQKPYQEPIESMELLNAQYKHEIEFINDGKFGIPKSQRDAAILNLMNHIKANIEAIEEIKGFIEDAADL